MKRCDLKENSEISIRRIEEATAILSANLGYSGATYNLPEAPGGGYNLNYTLSKKYENKLNVGIRFDSEEIASLLINVTSNFKGKLPSTLSLTGRLGKRYTAGINYAWEPAPLKRVGLSYLFQYNDVNFIIMATAHTILLSVIIRQSLLSRMCGIKCAFRYWSPL